MRVRVCADLHWWHSFLRVCVFLQWFKEPNDVMPWTINYVGTITSGLLYWVMNCWEVRRLYWRQRPQRWDVKGDLASEAQRRYALKCTRWCICACLCLSVRGFTWVAQVGLLAVLLFEYGKDPRACFVSAFSYNCSRSPRTSCIQRSTRGHDYLGDRFIG